MQKRLPGAPACNVRTEPSLILLDLPSDFSSLGSEVSKTASSEKTADVQQTHLGGWLPATRWRAVRQLLIAWGTAHPHTKHSFSWLLEVWKDMQRTFRYKKDLSTGGWVDLAHQDKSKYLLFSLHVGAVQKRKATFAAYQCPQLANCPTW